MKNNFVLKLVTTLLVIIMLSLTISVYSVSATSEDISENQEEVLQEEKILMYDAETGETTEIDMDQLRQNIAMTYSQNGTEMNRVEPYFPNQNINTEYRLNRNTSSEEFHRIPEVTGFPNTAICRVGFDGGSGSGFLIGSNLLLTNAHCVMNKKNNNSIFTNWVAYPGFNNGDVYEEGLQAGWSQIFYSSNWLSTHSDEDDWCLCILQKDLGNSTGYFGAVAYGTEAEMNNLQVRAVGYPDDYGGTYDQYYTLGRILTTYSGKFNMTTPLSDGMSGGPITTIADTGTIIGIAKGNYTYNTNIYIGVRITQNIIDLVRAHRT